MKAGHSSLIHRLSLRRTGVPESCTTAISFLRDQMAIPAEKLLLGLPFCGFVLEASRIRGPSDGGRHIDYGEVMMKWAEGWLDVQMGRSLDGAMDDQRHSGAVDHLRQSQVDFSEM